MNEKEYFEQFEVIASKALKQWKVPCVSLGVIKNGEVVYAKGFGQKSLTDTTAPDADTIFQIGSCSKAYTSAVVSALCDEGLLDLDTPVFNYMPELVFNSDVLTKECTLRDLLSHRTGVPGHDLAWYSSSFTREQLVHNMRYYASNKPIRTTYQYNNLCFVLAGCICEKVTGKCWEDLVEQYIIAPLELKRTFVWISDIKESKNHAQPCDINYENGEMIEVPFYQLENESKADKKGASFAPAGVMGSCVNDMLKWVNFHLNNGKYNDKQIISQKMMNEMHSPNTIIKTGPTIAVTEHVELPSYCLGWQVKMYRGKKVVSHTGSIDGFCAHTSFIPEMNIGIVVYTNNTSNPVPSTLGRMLTDHYLGVTDFELFDRFVEFFKLREEATNNYAQMLVGEKKENTQYMYPLEQYTGSYKLNGYQDVVITLKDGKLMYELGFQKGVLTHYHNETFVTTNPGSIVPAGIPFVFQSCGNLKDVIAVDIGIEVDDEIPWAKFKKVK